MSLQMTNNEGDGVTVVELDGRIVLDEESNALLSAAKSGAGIRLDINEAKGLNQGEQARPK
jgi:hypothetical protein